jgi:hypothetical protein
MARGMRPNEARRQARLKFGKTQKVRESLWKQNTIAVVESAWRDVKYAMRTLLQTPSFTVTAVLVIALGIGVNTAVFEATFGRPPSFGKDRPNPGRRFQAKST